MGAADDRVRRVAGGQARAAFELPAGQLRILEVARRGDEVVASVLEGRQRVEQLRVRCRWPDRPPTCSGVHRLGEHLAARWIGDSRRLSPRAPATPAAPRRIRSTCSARRVLFMCVASLPWVAAYLSQKIGGRPGVSGCGRTHDRAGAQGSVATAEPQRDLMAGWPLHTLGDAESSPCARVCACPFAARRATGGACAARRIRRRCDRAVRLRPAPAAAGSSAFVVLAVPLRDRGARRVRGRHRPHGLQPGRARRRCWSSLPPAAHPVVRGRRSGSPGRAQVSLAGHAISRRIVPAVALASLPALAPAAVLAALAPVASWTDGRRDRRGAWRPTSRPTW